MVDTNKLILSKFNLNNKKIGKNFINKSEIYEILMKLKDHKKIVKFDPQITNICKIGEDNSFFSQMIKKSHNDIKIIEKAKNNFLPKNNLISVDKRNDNLEKNQPLISSHPTSNCIKNDDIINKPKETNKLSENNSNLKIINNIIPNQPKQNYIENLIINHLSLLQEISLDGNVNIVKNKRKLQEFQKLKKSNKIMPITKSWMA